MKHNSKRKNKKLGIFIPILFTITYLLFTNTVSAATLETTIRSDSVKIGEEFTVPIRLSTEESNPINAFSIAVLYPTESLTFVGSDENNSIVPLWVQKPKEEGGHILIEGAIPGGFTQVLDPLTQVYSPGLVTTLIFKPIKSGAGYVRSSSVSLFANNGTGNTISSKGFSFPFTVADQIYDLKYEYKDDIPPLPFNISLEKSDLIFNGAYFIVFSAIDKDSGINYYEIREGNNSWKKGESPYELTDQSLSSIIRVRAVDKGGNETIAVLPATNAEAFSWTLLISVFAVVLIILILILTLQSRKRKKSSIQ